MNQFQCEKLSTSRTTLMGLAMLLVVFFHSSIVIPPLHVLLFIKQSGDIGVDIFLFVSGIGIFFSLQGEHSYVNYARRRAIRILPSYILINGLWFVLQDLILSSSGFGRFISDITSLSFWFGGSLSTWYLSGLLLLQL